jgi:hypothetical protein
LYDKYSFKATAFNTPVGSDPRRHLYFGFFQSGADIIKMDLKEMNCVDVDCIWFTVAGSCEQDEETFGCTQGNFLIKSYNPLTKESALWTY